MELQDALIAPEVGAPTDYHAPILASAMSDAQMDQRPYLNAEQGRLLQQRYLHHSADWHPSHWKLAPLDMFYVNRPTEDGQRVIIPNEAKP